MLAETIDGPVGIRSIFPGSVVPPRTRKITNFSRDQDKIAKMLASISIADGGQKERGAAPPLSGPNGTCANAISDGIATFQLFWKRKGVFKNIDGIVDPDGHTLQQMNALIDGTVSPNSGAWLARRDVPLARQKVQLSIAKLRAYQAIMNATESGPQDPVVEDALVTHYRLVSTDSGVNPPRWPINDFILNHLIRHFVALDGVLAANSTSFVDGLVYEADGSLAPAASNMDSKQVIFTTEYCDYSQGGFGPQSRAAILIHEGYHSVDAEKRSADDTVHISEWQPQYANQPPRYSIYNPSSYASFAAHVFKGSDPSPRYGAGAGRAL
jgi:hypothetical protein